MASTQQQSSLDARLAGGAVLADIQNVAPAGTKAWMLCLGYMNVDEGWVVHGGGQSLISTLDTPKATRRTLPLYAVLIEHPHEGLLLWECGAGPDYPTVWGPEASDAFARTDYRPEHELGAAIAATGHSYKDVKAIIMGHLHLDHAGGLTLFQGTDVPIWVHENELKTAFYSVATGADAGVYLPHYLDLGLNWKTFNERQLDFAQGITLHHLPGHTDGLCGMQLNLPRDGTFIFTTDQYHVKENYEQGVAAGWVLRDWSAWFDSHNRVKRLAKRTGGRVIMGHDYDTCHEIWDKWKGAPLQ